MRMRSYAIDASRRSARKFRVYFGRTRHFLADEARSHRDDFDTDALRVRAFEAGSIQRRNPRPSIAPHAPQAFRQGVGTGTIKPS